jgi:DNA-binding SARP family transcriptional activator
MIPRPLIRVHTMGQSLIEVQRSSLRPDAEVLFGTLLILCAERGRRVERETILTMLWPREKVQKRRHNLRQVLYKLRQLGVDAGGAAETLSIARSAVWLDYEDMDSASGGEAASAAGARFMQG